MPETLRERWRKEPPPGEVPNSKRIQLLVILCFWLIAAGFLLDSPMNIVRGLWTIVINKSNLITDYIALAGIGAAFVNSGLTTFLSVLMLKRANVYISGPVFAGVFIIAGFAFFGKNVYNSIPITIGVYLFSVATRIRFKTVILAALFGSALSPVVSQITFGFNLPLYQSIPFAFLAGIIIGLVLPVLSSRFVNFHHGFNLYNTGFAAGIVGMFTAGVLRMFGLEVTPVRILSSGNNMALGLVLLALFVFLFLFGFWFNRKGMRNYKELMENPGRMVADFIGIYGYGITLINMAFVGAIATIYVLLLGAQINGPVFGAILTLTGFGAFGKHPKNIIPIILGVYLASLLNILEPTSTDSVIAALFGTAIAPIAGYYGVLAGVLAGFFHMSMVLNVGYLHGGMNLYNNGFSAGFVAATLVPLLDIWEQTIRGKGNERVVQGETSRR